MKRRMLLLILSLMLLLPLSSAAVNLDLSRLVNVVSNASNAVTEVSEKEEIQIGRGLSSNMLGAVGLVNDPELQQYVNRVGLWLAMQTERPNLPWHFGVLNTSTVNAFAAPGGYVFITLGLFRILKNEAELAGVLAHEIAHVIKKHHLAAIKKQAQAGVAAGLVSMFVTEGGALVDAVLDVGMQLYARGLDRGDELQADRIGVVIATRAGYEPWGLPASLQTLDGMNPQDQNLAFMFSTHPPTRDRLTALDREMEGKFGNYAGQPQVADRFLQIQQRHVSQR